MGKCSLCGGLKSINPPRPCKNRCTNKEVRSPNGMNDLLLAIELERKYNSAPIEECVKEFEEHTGQKVPKEAIDKFRLSGLNNVDFLTSNWLHQYGLRNLLTAEVATDRK